MTCARPLSDLISHPLPLAHPAPDMPSSSPFLRHARQVPPQGLCTWCSRILEYFPLPHSLQIFALGRSLTTPMMRTEIPSTRLHFPHCTWCLFPARTLVLGAGIFVLKVLVPQSCPTLCDPMDCSLPGSSVHGILWARILE